jgi:hypothetical protein
MPLLPLALPLISIPPFSPFGPSRIASVGIHPRINYMKLDEHMQKRIIAKGAYRALSFFCLFLNSCGTNLITKGSQPRVYIHEQTRSC